MSYQNLAIALNPLREDDFKTNLFSAQLKETLGVDIPTVPVEELASYDYVFFEIQYDYTRDIYAFMARQVIPPVLDARIREGTAGILLSMPLEGFFHILPMVHDWIYRHHYPCHGIFYVTGSLSAQLVYDKMVEQRVFKYPEKINIIRFQYMEWYNNNAPVEFKTPPLEKKFLCLNKKSRLHRLMLLYVMKKLSLLDNFFYSYIEPVTDRLKTETSCHFEEPALLDTTIETPIFLDYVDETSALVVNDVYPGASSSVENYFNRSLFSVVNETQFTDTESSYQSIPYVFPSDKTFKALYFHHIPIINGGQGIVRYLRMSGYDVFDDIVDHSYDSITDSKDRFRSMCRSIKLVNDRYVTLVACETLRHRLKDRLIKNAEFLTCHRGKFLSLVEIDLQAALRRASKNHTLPY
jgi:hypothetical protein